MLPMIHVEAGMTWPFYSCPAVLRIEGNKTTKVWSLGSRFWKAVKYEGVEGVSDVYGVVRSMGGRNPWGWILAGILDRTGMHFQCGKYYQINNKIE
jgi:hypothetical protein